MKFFFSNSLKCSFISLPRQDSMIQYWSTWFHIIVLHTARKFRITPLYWGLHLDISTENIFDRYTSRLLLTTIAPISRQKFGARLLILLLYMLSLIMILLIHIKYIINSILYIYYVFTILQLRIKYRSHWKIQIAILETIEMYPFKSCVLDA